MNSIKKIFILIIIIIFVYTISQIIYFSSSYGSKYFCPNWSFIETKKTNIGDVRFPGHAFKFINDASCLNKTRVYDVVKIESLEDIRNAIEIAHEKDLYVSISGVRHSMGGQAFYKDSLILDMTNFNKILSLDDSKKVIKVQSGATWHQIQNYINSKDLAIKSMQSTDIFTVGGSLSVNAHGMDFRAGSLASTVKSFNILMSDGSIKFVTKKNNPELFNLVIGGYGLFGIILDIELKLTDNVMCEQELKNISYKDFLNYFENILQNKSYDIFYGHLSTSPLTFLKSVVTYGYRKINYDKPLPELRSISFVRLRRYLLNLSKVRWYGRVIKWIAEKYIDPIVINVFKKKYVSRNEVMHDSVEYLSNVISDDTDILHEYFVPKNKLALCIENFAKILTQEKSIVLNASIRYVPEEEIFLNYAPEDMFSIVLYINQKVSNQAIEKMKILTRRLINSIVSLGGTFFLPYQLYFTKDQLKRAYPNIDKFFQLKRKYDPHLLFMNTFYAKYAS